MNIMILIDDKGKTWLSFNDISNMLGYKNIDKAMELCQNLKPYSYFNITENSKYFDCELFVYGDDLVNLVKNAPLENTKEVQDFLNETIPQWYLGNYNPQRIFKNEVTEMKEVTEIINIKELEGKVFNKIDVKQKNGEDRIIFHINNTEKYELIYIKQDEDEEESWVGIENIEGDIQAILGQKITNAFITSYDDSKFFIWFYFNLKTEKNDIRICYFLSRIAYTIDCCPYKKDDNKLKISILKTKKLIKPVEEKNQEIIDFLFNDQEFYYKAFVVNGIMYLPFDNEIIIRYCEENNKEYIYTDIDNIKYLNELVNSGIVRKKSKVYGIKMVDIKGINHKEFMDNEKSYIGYWERGGNLFLDVFLGDRYHDVASEIKDYFKLGNRE